MRRELMYSTTSSASTIRNAGTRGSVRSEEHTSELQSLTNLVCRLLLEKKKNTQQQNIHYHKSTNKKNTHNKNTNRQADLIKQRYQPNSQQNISEHTKQYCTKE